MKWAVLMSMPKAKKVNKQQEIIKANDDPRIPHLLDIHPQD
jgi:hypothetical protein